MRRKFCRSRPKFRAESFSLVGAPGGAPKIFFPHTSNHDGRRGRRLFWRRSEPEPRGLESGQTSLENLKVFYELIGQFF